MSPIKQKTIKKSSKHPYTYLDLFQNDDADMAFNDHYKRAPIILERTMDLDSLKSTFIPDVFKERIWTKLLHLRGDVFEILIREFFVNAIVEGDHINY